MSAMMGVGVSGTLATRVQQRKCVGLGYIIRAGFCHGRA
jgi:hypothetical protein